MAKLWQLPALIGRSLQQFGEWILGATKRLFSPRDDEYPATGIQPFEGDIPDVHHHHSSW